MPFPYTSVAVLGDGVTATSVRRCLALFNCPEASPWEADIVVSSPGIPPEHYPDTPIEIISEIEFSYRVFMALGTCPTLIGVTGTNGKTTVTSLLGHALQCPVAGNIGKPLVEFVHPQDRFKMIAVELSSYQLEGCSTFNVDIAIILNITEDHLLRHKTLENYALAKAKLWQNQTEKNVLIYNSEDALVEPLVQTATSHKVPITDADLYLTEHPYLKGRHNRFNYNVVIAAMLTLGYSQQVCIDRVLTFKGVAHRIELLGHYQGRLVVNDSKATNPDSTLKAVESFSQPPHLILGGDDKGLDYAPFIKTLIDKGCIITVYGTLGTVIPPGDNIRCIISLADAVDYVFSITKPGDLILLSPGSSSFDQFKNYEERGDFFKQYIKNYES